jgi:hypothetical protein
MEVHTLSLLSWNAGHGVLPVMSCMAALDLATRLIAVQASLAGLLPDDAQVSRATSEYLALITAAALYGIETDLSVRHCCWTALQSMVWLLYVLK